MTWKINTLEYKNDADKGVIKAHWDCTKTETKGKGEDKVEYTGRVYGSCGFSPDPTSEGYIKYEDLTEEIVIGWVHEKISKADHEAKVTAQIEAQKNPVIIKGTPWT
tara:strand:- start:95 stop:415 length:321 start_codon:yes stop_codon:yes gene_type:complete